MCVSFWRDLRIDGGVTSDHDALGGDDWAIEFAQDERLRRLECPKLPEFHCGAEFSGNPRVSLPVLL
ncbi:hypothetical protein PVK06_012055 [Gossypium arboreum]|uniref:Uncharacterized protein n=1 Tax=Gossypium arboreum TaxID=29729 RepID=A0ABR0QAQ7_GOSAR|nr:hypothetical protein PVK06_012055 [Gossypium arboreum]